jgi:iron(III) transport system substrate-binding protein
VALTNSYYLVRLMRSKKAEDRAVAQAVGLVWPDQAGFGTNMNVSGAGLMRNAPNRDNAIAFLEYLASDAAQAYFANGNNEWPVVRSAVISNPELAALGNFKRDPLSVAALGKNVAAAQRIVDRVGWR